jgi:hypothetical protein
MNPPIDNFDNKVDFINFKKECQELLSIYRFKDYRRHQHIFKIKHNKQWKAECTLAEFVWNFCKTPRFAPLLMTYVNAMTLDETVVKKWLTNSNIDIDADLTFIDIMDGITHLSENPNTTHAHVLSDQLHNGEILIDQSTGDLLHGLVVTEEDYEKINHISIEFESFETDTHVKYLIHKSEMDQDIYVLNEGDKTEGSEESMSDIYYIPFFEHPVPLVHLQCENPFGMQIKVGVCFEGEYSNEDEYDIYTLSTILNKQIHNWLKNRNLLLTLKDSDLLRVGKKCMKIVQ